MSFGLGLSVCVAAPPGATISAEPNPNLLLWSEQFQRAQWGASNATVTADAATDPDGGSTADQIAFSDVTGIISQTTDTAAGSGSLAASDVEAPLAWTRESVTGVFDGLSYTFSVYLKGDRSTVRIGIDRSGGFLRCLIRDTGDEATFFAWGAKLEQATGPTAYVKREGT